MKNLWWLNFVHNGELLGAAVVCADSFDEAVEEASRLENYPGGDVFTVPRDEIPDDLINKFTPCAELIERGLVTPATRHRKSNGPSSF